MYIVYVLRSGLDNNLYIGCTSNLDNRVNAHNKSYVRATKHRRPMELVYSEEFADKYEAYKKERHYKSAKGKKELKKKMALPIISRSEIEGPIV